MPRINTYTDNTSIEDDDKLLTYDTQGAATKLTAFSRIWTWIQSKIHAITASTSAWTAANDKVVVDRNGTLSRIDYSILAKAIVESYNGSTLAGSAQAVKTAIDALNSNFCSLTGATDINSSTTKNAIYTKYDSMADNTLVVGELTAGVRGSITIYKGTSNYGYASFTSYTDTGNADTYTMSKYNGTWSDWIKSPTRSEVNTLNSKFGTVTSGSFHDFAGKNGVFWVGGSVTDKPDTGAGLLVFGSYSNSYCAGLYVVLGTGKVYSVTYNTPNWSYTQLS